MGAADVNDSRSKVMQRVQTIQAVGAEKETQKMTTTADKINELVQDIKILRDEVDRLDGRLQDIAFNAESKSPDPEPLECIVEFRNGKPLRLADGDSIIQNTYEMRQITPQMEQDAEDAAELRRLKNRIDEYKWRELMEL